MNSKQAGVGWLGGRAAQQVGLLVGTQGLGITLSFALTVLITRNLDAAAYGSFRYAVTFLTFANTLLQLGWPYSASRVLAIEQDNAAQASIAGACAVLVGIGTVIGTAGTFAIFHAAKALGHPLPDILLWVAPFMHVTLAQYMIVSMCQGLNRIAVLSIQQVLPYVILLPLTALQVYVLKSYSLVAALAGYVLVFTLVNAFGFLQLGASFGNCGRHLRRILTENRRTGFPIYIGGVFGVASAQLIAMWVAEFVNPVRYGQYALAAGMAGPLTMFVAAVGTVMFRSSSGSRALSHQVLASSLALGLVLGGVFFVGTDWLMVPIFGAQYAPAVRMAQWMAAGYILIGWGDIFQRFLGSHGLGKRLGGAAVASGLVGVISAAIMLPRWDAHGAIASSVLAGATYFALMLALYVQHTQRSNVSPPGATNQPPAGDGDGRPAAT